MGNRSCLFAICVLGFLSQVDAFATSLRFTSGVQRHSGIRMQQSQERISRRSLLAATPLLFAPLAASAGDYYLEELTPEAKEAQQRREAYVAKQAAYKKEWDRVSAFFKQVKTDEDAMRAFEAYTALLRREGQLPSGEKRDAFRKRVAVKRNESEEWWTIQVQIAYKDLLRAIDKSIAPKKESSIYD